MTITVQITYSEGDYQRVSNVTVTDEALADVRFKFNPSGLKSVEDLKALAAAFFTLCVEGHSAKPDAGCEFAIARTEVQTACMWAVAGATKGL